MTRRKAKNRRPKPKDDAPPPPRIEALRAKARQLGVPAFLPTLERAEAGELDIERITETVHDRDRAGDRKTGRTVTTGFRVRDRQSSAKARLLKFRDRDGKRLLTEEQIAAGIRLETDWEAACLEPKLIANLLGTGGGNGGSGGIGGAVIDARTRVHLAKQSIRLAGAETVGIIEAIVLHGATMTAATAPRYADAARQNAHVSALLGIGLNLLAMHYRLGAVKDKGWTREGVE